MVGTTKRKQTKKRNSKTKNQNRKTKKKQNRKQKGGNIDELSMIIRDESLDALKEYVKQGKNINKKGSKGITALMEAVAIQDKEKIEYLIEQGAHVNAVADDGTTAYSVAFGNDAITELLKNAGAKTNPIYLLLLAIEKNNDKTAKVMIKNREALGLDINEKVPEYKPIQLEDGSEKYIYEYPVTLAIKKDNLGITKDLLDAGASLAIESDNTQHEVVQFMDIGETPIILAAKEDNLLMIELLLEENQKRDVYERFDINQSSKGNFTALYRAVENNSSSIVEKLLQAGANPNSQNGPDKVAPIIQAVDDSYDVIVQLLVEAGADMNARTPDYFENTPLILAAYYGDMEIIKILVEAGADMDIKNNEDVDALDAAYESGYMNIVRYFSDQGHLAATDLLLNMNEQEPAKRDTNLIVQQIQPKSIEHEPKGKPIPEILQAPNPTFYDVIDMEEKEIKSYLSEDPDNVVFIYKQQVIGTNKQQLKNEFTTNRTKIMLECKEANTFFHQPEKNLIKDDENNLLYYLNMDIVGLLGILLPISQLKTLTHMDKMLSPDSPPFAPGESPPFAPGESPPFASYEPMTPPFPPPSDSEFGEDLSPIRGGNLYPNIFVVDTSEDPKTQRAITSFGAYDGDNVVSAKHCAEEEPMKVGKLYSVNFPKKSVKRTRSKSPKNKTQKSRKQPKTP